VLSGRPTARAFPAGRFDHEPGETNNDPHHDNQGPGFSKNPKSPLRDLVARLNVRELNSVQSHAEMDYAGNMGHVMNILFEEEMAAAREHEAGYWRAKINDSDDLEYLAYSQTITGELAINGLSVRFPHVTTNAVRGQSATWPARGRPRSAA
jgi:hypothetical protein